MSNWDEIISDYCKAQECFWGPKEGGNWHRNDDDGFYYLWKAYHEAKSAEEKSPLWYGRILYMMADEHRYKFSNWEILKKYASPAVEQFRFCTPETGMPTEKEKQCAENLYSWLKYENDNENDDLYLEQVKLIEGYEKLAAFGFHDSKPVRFEHDEKNASLWLDYNGKIAELRFEGVYELAVNGDPTCNWINDFHLYRDGFLSDLVKFDIGYYRIRCKSVKVVSVSEKAQEILHNWIKTRADISRECEKYPD